MKSSLLVIAAFFFLVVAADAQTCEPNANQAAFFIDADFRGACVVRGGGSYPTLDRLGLPNDSVSSVKIGANVAVRVCEHVQFGGRCATLTGSVLSMVNTAIGNDQVSSYEVISKSVGTAQPPRPAQPTPTGSTASLEQTCYNAVQGKVAWDAAGNKGWGDLNLRSLCKGTTNPAATISCFQSKMPQLAWARAIQECAPGQRATTPVLQNPGSTTPVVRSPVSTTPVGPNPGLSPPVIQNPTSTAPVVSAPVPTAPALSAPDMKKVMNWIAVRTSALRLPFCWRDTYTRGQRAADCPAGYTNVAATCLLPASTYSAPSRLASCPPGYTNWGLYCQKGANIFDTTTTMVCPPGYFIGTAKRCYQTCRSGYTNNGEFCGRGAATLGMDTMKCGASEGREGAFCYPTCKAGYEGGLNFCSQKCPAQQTTNCGLGCATSSGECRSAVFDMASAPFVAALNIATLGRASAATSGVKAAKLAASASKMTKAVDSIKKAIKVAGAVSDAYTVASAVNSQAELFATEFSDNFDVLTSPEIEAEVNRNFSPRAAYQIKRQWGMRHLTLMLEADGFATAKNIMSVVGVFDPTGVVDLVNAYAHPICKPDTPFPRVAALY